PCATSLKQCSVSQEVAHGFSRANVEKRRAEAPGRTRGSAPTTLCDLCVLCGFFSIAREQALRQHAPDRIRQAEAIVAGDFAGPEFPADQLAMSWQAARRERLLVLLRVPAEYLRRR